MMLSYPMFAADRKLIRQQGAKEGTCMSKVVHEGGPSGAIYGLGLIGAAVFFISQATGFWGGVVGFLKALVWPAFLVYELFKSLL